MADGKLLFGGLPLNALGLCSFSEKKIYIRNYSSPELILPKREKRRLVRLGQGCIEIARIFDEEFQKNNGEDGKRVLEERSRSYSPNWFFGVIGGVTVNYADMLFECVRDVFVEDGRDEVFHYVEEYPESSLSPDQRTIHRVLAYVPGRWEDIIKRWNKKARQISRRAVVIAR